MITRHFPSLFLRQGLRALGRHPVLLLLNVFSIALGVAVFLAIQIANRSANESFRAGVELVAGRANLEVRGNIDETLYPRIAKLDGVASSTPIVEGIVSLPGHPGEYLRIVGVDPFTGDDLRTFELLGADRAKIDLDKWLSEPHAIAVSQDYVERVLPKVGPPVRVLAAGRSVDLVPTFTIQPATASGDPRVAAMDLGWAQELLHRPGQLSTILLLVDPVKLESVRDQVRALVPGDVEVSTPGLRSRQIESMLGAFQLNLTALSLVSVLVGAFLIYNTISASVVRRRTEIGVLRAVGASRAEIRLLFLGEAAVCGLIGTALGAGLALPLANALAAPVAETIRTLYILTSVERLFLSPWQFVEALAVGLGTALLAAWVPANEAARTDPARALHPGSTVSAPGKSSPRWLVVAAVLLILSTIAGWATLRFHLPPLGFISALGVLAGFSFLVPATIRLTAFLLRSQGRYLPLAAMNFARAMHRNAVTVAALAAAIAMTVSVSVMIQSFRASVQDWINATLVDDLFIGIVDNASGATLPPGAEEFMREQPGVTAVASRADTTIPFRDSPVDLGILTGTRPDSVRFIGTNPARQFEDFFKPDSVMVSEPFANRFGVRLGDNIELKTPRGPVRFRVAGVFQDYARSNGLVYIDRRNYEAHWPPMGTQALALKLASGTDIDRLGESFRAHFGAAGQFSVYSNVALRAKIFDIFDQTFAVTLVLRTISILVAAAGVTLSLLILTAERTREIGVLRSIGASRLQIVGLFIREAGLIGLTSSIVGVISGACLSMVLTWVVNKAFFGWTIQLSYPPTTLLSTPLWIIPVAVLAALLPAWQAARQPPARAVRFE